MIFSPLFLCVGLFSFSMQNGDDTHKRGASKKLKRKKERNKSKKKKISFFIERPFLIIVPKQKKERQLCERIVAAQVAPWLGLWLEFRLSKRALR